MEPVDERVVSLERVDAGYPGEVVLGGLTFDVRRGEVFVLLGGSGCGKSTVMKHMIGLNPVLSGRLTVAGMEWTPANRASLCRRIGVMYQSGALFGSMTCLENVMLPLEEFTRLGRAERRERACALLADVELLDAAGKMPCEISGGMRKRVAIARAMALDPEVVFLDEPSAGLDPITSAGLDDLILRLRGEKGMTFVVVTHELPSVFRIGDRAAMFDRTRRAMVALGPPAELRDSSDDPFVRKFFSRGGCHV
ncbi:MAG: ATP-binding cassette domain-containing protein [Kiritimatiellae bacterium]|nr:ATP-binding cassette domain-containing protein [Kiritimatiellia bacterium]